MTTCNLLRNLWSGPYSIYQVEYSRNLLFHNGHHMEQVFDGMVDRTRTLMDVKRVLTIFGVKQRRLMVKGTPRRFEVALETPVYDLTVFKIHFGKLTLKMYTKGERVLRAEAIVHNVAELRLGKVIERFADVVRHLSVLLDRFLANVQCMDRAWINDQELEHLPQPSFVGRTRVGGIDINKPRIRAAMRAVLAVASAPNGFTAADHAAQVRQLWPEAGERYAARQSAYDLKKLAAKGFVQKTAPRSRKYVATPKGIQFMAGLHVLREKVLKPLLTYGGRCKSGPKPRETAALDHRYQAVQREMQHLLKHLNFAA